MKEPEDVLEKSLINATNDPGQRSQFYRDLLDSELIFITPINETQKTGIKVLEQGTTIQFVSIEKDGIIWIPAFSSLIKFQMYINTESSFLKINAKDFFEFTTGAYVVLNPKSKYWKELIPEEISSIMDGSIFQTYQEIEIKKETKVLLGAPSIYPKELVSEIKKVFARNKHVLRAYLTLSQTPDFEEKPHFLIGIEVDGEWEKVLNDVGAATTKLLAKDEFVDFIHIDNSQVSQYLINETKPFYKKSQLIRLFG